MTFLKKIFQTKQISRQSQKYLLCSSYTYYIAVFSSISMILWACLSSIQTHYLQVTSFAGGKRKFLSGYWFAEKIFRTIKSGLWKFHSMTMNHRRWILSVCLQIQRTNQIEDVLWVSWGLAKFVFLNLLRKNMFMDPAEWCQVRGFKFVTW